MTAATHTPGPWKATRLNAGEWSIDGDDWSIAVVCGGAGHEGSNGRSDDNARLIAAAPDLLEALRDLVDAYEGNDRFIRVAREALAKAGLA